MRYKFNNVLRLRGEMVLCYKVAEFASHYIDLPQILNIRSYFESLVKSIKSHKSKTLTIKCIWAFFTQFADRSIAVCQCFIYIYTLHKLDRDEHNLWWMVDLCCTKRMTGERAFTYICVYYILCLCMLTFSCVMYISCKESLSVSTVWFNELFVDLSGLK